MMWMWPNKICRPALAGTMLLALSVPASSIFGQEEETSPEPQPSPAITFLAVTIPIAPSLTATSAPAVPAPATSEATTPEATTAGVTTAAVASTPQEDTAEYSYLLSERWQAVGLNEREAAVHLLHRLTFGPRPDDIERLLNMGLDNWVEWQLNGDSAGSALSAALTKLPSIALDAKELRDRYPHQSYIIAEAIAAGEMKRSAFLGHEGVAAQRRAERAMDGFAEDQSYEPPAEVLSQLQAQKLYHALLSEAQLREVLTDFWFNHFNVSARGKVLNHVASYENEAIRPRVLGNFEALLLETARHPAMLYYLGNVHSVADMDRATPFDARMEGFEGFSPGSDPGLEKRLQKELPWWPPEKRLKLPKSQGLNENFARELLELHTLGVQGGYDQDDVVDVARAFTGWTTLPHSPSKAGLRDLLTTAGEDEEWGFVVHGEFVFRPDLHDGEVKTLLGQPLTAGRGVEDGLEVLSRLSRHPSTAEHLCRKLAVRFVDDAPSESLVAHLATTFLESNGDLREVMRQLIYSSEFWQSALDSGKLKTPFELVVSALRVIDAEVEEPATALYWVRRIGQSPYRYGAPTGFSDEEEAWVDGGALLQRVNFALTLARGRLKGVNFDRLSLLAGLEPITPEETMLTLLPLILPEKLPGDALIELSALSKRPRVPFDPLADDTSARADGLREARFKRNIVYALGVLLAAPEFQYR